MITTMFLEMSHRAYLSRLHRLTNTASYLSSVGRYASPIFSHCGVEDGTVKWSISLENSSTFQTCLGNGDYANLAVIPRFVEAYDC